MNTAQDSLKAEVIEHTGLIGACISLLVALATGINAIEHLVARELPVLTILQSVSALIGVGLVFYYLWRIRRIRLNALFSLGLYDGFMGYATVQSLIVSWTITFLSLLAFSVFVINRPVLIALTSADVFVPLIMCVMSGSFGISYLVTCRPGTKPVTD